MIFGVDTISESLDDLRARGISMAAPALVPWMMADIVEHLEHTEVYGSHVAAKATKPPEPFTHAYGDSRWQVFSHTMQDLVLAPHWFEYALAMFPIARAYFGGEFPRLYSLNAFWSQPAEGELYGDTQWWHRDGDDPHQLTAFMFGTDVMVRDDGSHLYQVGTHKIRDEDLGWPFREDPPELPAEVFGFGGTVFFVDTNGLHKAIRPITRPRLLVWARWSTANPPASYGWDELRPVRRELLRSRYPDDPTLQEAVRLVVD